MALMGIIVVAIMDKWVTIVTWRWLDVFPPLAVTVSCCHINTKNPGEMTLINTVLWRMFGIWTTTLISNEISVISIVISSKTVKIYDSYKWCRFLEKDTIESFRFWDEDDYDYEIFWVVLAREPASFWRENVKVVVILLRVLVSFSGENKL